MCRNLGKVGVLATAKKGEKEETEKPLRKRKTHIKPLFKKKRGEIPYRERGEGVGDLSL